MGEMENSNGQEYDSSNTLSSETCDDAMDTLEFFMKELSSSETAEQINALKNVKYVAHVVGPCSCRLDLIPLLLDFQDKEEDYELLYTLAEVWGVLSDYVGGDENFSILYAPLEWLLKSSEKLVWQQAVASTELILSKLETSNKSEFIDNYILPTIRRLAKDSSIVPRIVACNLIVAAVKNSSDHKENQNELIEIFKAFFTDSNLLIVRAAMGVLTSLFCVLTKDVIISSSLLSTVREIWIQDEFNRVHILLAILAVARKCSPEENRFYTMDYLREAVINKLWRVRLAVAESFADFVEVYNEPFLLDVAVELLLALLADGKVEIRANAVKSIGKMSSFMNKEDILTRLTGCLEDISLDHEVSVRAEFGECLYCLAKKMSKDEIEKFLSLNMYRCFQDYSTEVKLSLLKHIGEIFTKLEISSLEHPLFLAVRDFYADNEWRIRYQFILQFPQIIQFFEFDAHVESQMKDRMYEPEDAPLNEFADYLLNVVSSALSDEIHTVRRCMADNLHHIYCFLGEESFEKYIWPRMSQIYLGETSDDLKTCCSTPEYLLKINILRSLPMISTQAANKSINYTLSSLLLTALGEAVPNVRLVAVEVAAASLLHLPIECHTPIQSAFKKLEQDADLEVAYSAFTAIEKLSLCVKEEGVVLQTVELDRV